MAQPSNRLHDLYQKWFSKTASEDERKEFFSLLEQTDAENVSGWMQDAWKEKQDDRRYTLTQQHLLADAILKRFPAAEDVPVHRIHFLRTPWFRWAAAVILLLGGSVYFFYHTPVTNEIAVVHPGPLKNDILPGREGAILTLADGSTIVLDSVGNGVVAQQLGTQVVLNNGQLVYNSSKNSPAGPIYNTMTTPKGRQFKVMLSDGTTVWLNAASSIRYPTMFSGQERKVEITGEAYFEVAKNEAAPFRVDIHGNASIDVLGTQFNVNAYTNEERVKTTLLKGSVRISNRLQQKILRPDEQAVMAGNDAVIKVNRVNTGEVVAWKNGAFNLENLSLKEVMRQLERWYDVEVIYEAGIPDIHFFGKISRDLSLAEIIKVLEASKVHFRIDEGNKLVVLP